jgi:hypothetical protein
MKAKNFVIVGIVLLGIAGIGYAIYRSTSVQGNNGGGNGGGNNSNGSLVFGVRADSPNGNVNNVIPGANIAAINASGQETDYTADSNGQISIYLPAGSYSLIVSATGYTTQKLSISITANHTVYGSASLGVS